MWAQAHCFWGQWASDWLKQASHCPTDRGIGVSDEKSDVKLASGRTCVRWKIIIGADCGPLDSIIIGQWDASLTSLYPECCSR